MCCQKSELFSLKNCRFNIERVKESTARVVVFRAFDCMLSFTLECSFFGKQNAEGRLVHMTRGEMELLGETLVKTLHHYLPKVQGKLL